MIVYTDNTTIVIRSLNLHHLSNQSTYPDHGDVIGDGQTETPTESLYPPGEVIPDPGKPEILPNPDLPEEEEYLPDEEERPLEDPLREIPKPYLPGREEDFPPEKEEEWPEDPRRK